MTIAPIHAPLSKYEEGSFENVLKALDKQNETIVDIKRIRKAEKNESREVAILQMLICIPYCA